MVDEENINIETFRFALKRRRMRDDVLILMVEDEEFSGKLLRGVLSKNHQVISASDGEMALAAYVKNAPDIVFLDINLPGVSGHKVLDVILKLDSDAFVVMVSANNYADDVRKALSSGAKEFVVKPFSKQKIENCINMYISQRRE